MAINDNQLSEDERESLIGSLRLLLQRNAELFRTDVKAGWKLLAELGLAQLCRPAGAGGLKEAVLALQELGAASCSAPLVGSILTNVLSAKFPLLADLAQGLDSGDVGVAFVFPEFDKDADGSEVTVAGNEISGTFSFIEGKAALTTLVIVTSTSLALLDLSATGAETINATLLGSLPSDRISVKNAPVKTLSLAAHDKAEIVTLAQLLMTTRGLGAARCGFSEVVEYVTTRRQFGQPIGRFQAIQHKLANCFTTLEALRLSAFNAADAFDVGNPDWRFFSAATSAYGNQTLRQVALEIHHTFGAIGYAEEHSMPHHFRQIHNDVIRVGGVREARRALAYFLLSSGAH